MQALRRDLTRYQDLASKASLAFLDSNGTDMAAMAPMNDSLATARANLATFRTDSFGEFVHTLNGTQHDAHVRLIMGLALGFMNLCFMAVLVYFIRNNMKMVATIAEQNATPRAARRRTDRRASARRPRTSTRCFTT